MIGLQNSAGWVRREIGRNLKLRLTPEIRFSEDTSLEEVYHLENVLQEINEADNAQRTEESPESEGQTENE